MQQQRQAFIAHLPAYIMTTCSHLTMQRRVASNNPVHVLAWHGRQPFLFRSATRLHIQVSARLACAKSTGVVEKHVLLGWGSRQWIPFPHQSLQLVGQIPLSK
ncbi:hypothetical protein AXX17_ATUG03700 (mitochondrion) [Arabidopsis thaliana]|uniref:Uncharacterized protein n=1 Tax=Arabidopsis thaliana TaxID=3702 RepID=A0A178U6B8_ARATH|nr:hypothetical protein AXX17_ATUG03700 [Arabidopsis thaliana]